MVNEAKRKAFFLETYTVSFFGHRKIHNHLYLDQVLDEFIMRLLREHSYVEFLVGRDGDFDQLISSAVRRCKRRYGHNNSALVWVMPYLSAFFRDNEEACHAYYDGIEICDISAAKHFKAAIQTRNKHMVDRSDLVVLYVETSSGGAYQTMQYALRQGKEIINLNHFKEDR